MPNPTPSFIVDGMLGSLARWLRLLGYEAEYLKDASDDTLLQHAAVSKNSILLTRDVELLKRAMNRDIQAFFVKEESKPQRLAGLAERFKIRLDVDAALSRCPICNGVLRKVEKHDVEEEIPHGSFTLYEEFWVCVSCEKVYWRGSHWKKIEEILSRARELLRDHTS